MESVKHMTSVQNALPTISPKGDVSFAEIPMPVQDIPVSAVEHNAPVAAVIKTNTYVVEISSNIPDRILSLILQEVSHA